MRTDKYYSASREVADKGGLTPYRYRIEGDRFLLSETDIKYMVQSGAITPTDFASLDIREVSDGEAERLIVEGGRTLESRTPPEEEKTEESGEEQVETPAGEVVTAEESEEVSPKKEEE